MRMEVTVTCSTCGKTDDVRQMTSDGRVWTCSGCHYRAVEINRRCCERAELLPCVCAASYRCPLHGDTHIGTHD